MADFLISYKATAVIEGGYANNPKDTGGETYKGIARNIDSSWSGWVIIDTIKAQVSTDAEAINAAARLNNVLQQKVLNFYKANYWDSLNLDNIDTQRMANELYDTGVNMGVGTAGKFLQRVLNAVNIQQIVVDGKIGPNTINKFNSLNNNDKYMVWKLFNCLQGARYIAIREANPSQEVFMRSWASRVFEQ